MNGKVLTLALLLLLSCGAPVRHHQVYAHKGEVSHLFAYTREEIVQTLGRLGFDQAFLGNIRRSATGDRLELYPNSASDHRVLFLWLDGHSEVRTAEGRFRFLQNQDKFMEWFRGGQGMVLPGGQVRSPTEFAKLAVDLSGTFFFTSVGENETAVASTLAPSRVLYLAPFLGQEIFSSEGTVYLFGISNSRNRSPNPAREVICDVLGTGEVEMKLLREVRIPPPSEPVKVGSRFYVADMSPFSQRVLLMDARDLPLWNRWVLFDLATGESTVLGRAQGHALFLGGDILGAVNKRQLATKS